MDNHPFSGAMIERGVVTNVRTDGYIVQSYTRYPVMTNALKSIGSNTYAVGDTVYYFMFNDGNGMILDRFVPMT